MTNPDRMKQIQQMLEENPGDSFLQYAAALELKKNGELGEAVKIMESILASDSRYLAAYYQLGKLYEKIGERDNATEIYKQGQALAKEQEDSKALAELTEALYTLEN
jgi:tetratricopeptide (TPR) repeat protein